MPSSNYQHISTVLHYATHLDPKRVLDIGVGNGAYGFMLRQYLDINKERVKRGDWQCTIDGIEIFEEYRNPVWSFAYDNVFIGDARNLIDGVGRYELILLNDILEHLTRNEARDLLRRALSHADAVIATTPDGEYPQGAWGGNEAERHLCTLTAADFPDLVASNRCGITACYICSTNLGVSESIKDAAAVCPGWPVSRARLALRRAARALRRIRSRSAAGPHTQTLS